MDQLFKTQGVMHYGSDSYCVVDLDPEIGRLYRAFIPEYIHCNPPMWQTHVTVVRTGAETVIPNRRAWGKYEGWKFEVWYSPCIMFGDTYIWLPAFSERLQEVRKELGLSPFFNTFQQFHVTIANMKGTRSQYNYKDFGDGTYVHPDEGYEDGI